jgi:hypothetical protein
MPWLAFHDRLMNRMVDFPMPDKSGSGEFSPVCMYRCALALCWSGFV